ncbi:GNAT family N-acetyltransferase [Nocardioides bizhenqiangii]|uniref:GNAT family N-acetyltransferase n=1 Tax=Nocardioides bizhenqiangii TaxID=3095076 RepID=A0ABZ0ZN34_9ACTN|nr:GNAT family N-acetyltransferase [Nocardioides sp. HM61]WQQ25735.1 GNAT family N-acetyltransferase [Nocardioides sp. HM61]
MLWRVRTNLPDRPGKLAPLAQECGKAGANIGAVQVFTGRTPGTATIELVVRTPDDWSEPDVIQMVRRAGGDSVVTHEVNRHALDDQPTRYVKAAQQILDHPETFPDVVAHLFDADVEPTHGTEDVLEMQVGNAVIQIRRETPFTPAERVRGSALAELVSDVLSRQSPKAPDTGGGAQPTSVAGDNEVSVLVSGRVIGRASFEPGAAGDEPWPVDMWVDPSWQRRGIGTRLLSDIARMARRQGAEEIVLTAPSDSQSVLPMVLSAGLRGRIRMAGDTVTVRIAVNELRT